MQLPEGIRALVSDELYKMDDIGLSNSSVLLFHDKVLKVQEYNEEAVNECRMMTWLKGKLPVPRILACETADNLSYLLMDKCSGSMACEEEYMQNPLKQAGLLAEGLKKLWSVAISECPSDWRLKNKLARARYNIEHDLVDLDNVEPETFGKNGFKDPGELLQWLWDHQPSEELVLSHGDYCLPNVFGTGEEVSGYIDLGRSGVADKWCDIALCYRSLSSNYSGRYHGKKYSGYDDLLLFKELGIKPDWEKIRYYILLDELF